MHCGNAFVLANTFCRFYGPRTIQALARHFSVRMSGTDMHELRRRRYAFLSISKVLQVHVH